MWEGSHPWYCYISFCIHINTNINDGSDVSCVISSVINGGGGGILLWFPSGADLIGIIWCQHSSTGNIGDTGIKFVCMFLSLEVDWLGSVMVVAVWTCESFYCCCIQICTLQANYLVPSTALRRNHIISWLRGV